MCTEHFGVSFRMLEIQPAPVGLETAHAVILTEGARNFVTELVQQFDADVERVT